MKTFAKRFLLILGILALPHLPACVENSAPVPNTEYPEETTQGEDDVSRAPELRQPDENDVIGKLESFEFATWNIEQFPKKSDATIEAVVGHIKKWQLDMVALQEVVSEKAFNELVERLEGFDGVLVQNQSDLRLGILFKSAEYELKASRELPLGDRYAFPRKPFLVELVRIADSEVIQIINVHLKARGGASNIARRLKANEELFAYAEAELNKNSSQKMILLGDFNAELESEEMSFWQADGSSYDVETLELELSDRYTYLGSFKSMIDHIVTVNFTVDETIIPEPFLDLDSYENVISDHLPVIAIDRP